MHLRRNNGAQVWQPELGHICYVKDGIDWVFRSPRTTLSTILTEESMPKMLVGEAFTLKYLRAHSSSPVAEVYASRYVSGACITAL